MIINKEAAWKFLRDIEKDEKIAIVFHDDADGMASGIFINNFVRKIGGDVEIFPFSISKTEITQEDLSDFDKIVILDLSENIAGKIINASGDKKVLYIDHHVKKQEFDEGVLELIAPSAIPVARTSYEFVSHFDSNLEWLAVAAVICDAGDLSKENDDFINDFLKREKITLEDYKKKYAYKLGDFLIYFKEDLKKAFEILLEVRYLGDFSEIEKYAGPVEEEIEKIAKDFDKNHEEIGSIKFYLFESKFAIKSALINKISFANPDWIIVFANPDEDIIKLSARNQSRKMNMIELLRTGIAGLKNADAGGHIPAAGGAIRVQDLELFKENLRKFIEKK